MAERDDAIKLANRVLDRISADPDDDLAVLARQFLRSYEDTQLLDWLDDFLKGGCFESCFEIDGGIHATFSPLGEQELQLRDQNDLRQILRQVSKDNPMEQS